MLFVVIVVIKTPLLARTILSIVQETTTKKTVYSGDGCCHYTCLNCH